MADHGPLPAWLHTFVWDCDPSVLDLGAHSVFIVERLLNAGNQFSLAWLFSGYGKKESRKP